VYYLGKKLARVWKDPGLKTHKLAMDLPDVPDRRLGVLAIAMGAVTGKPITTVVPDNNPSPRQITSW